MILSVLLAITDLNALEGAGDFYPYNFADVSPASYLIPNPKVNHFRIQGQEWKVKVHGKEPNGGTYTVYVFRDSELTFRQRYTAGGETEAQMCFFPTGFPVLAVRHHSFCGHGQTTLFYAFRNGSWKLILETTGEHGGPVFRDLDHDGKHEWIIDDNDFCLYEGGQPKWIMVYRETERGMVLWKRWPNRHRIQMKETLGPFWSD